MPDALTVGSLFTGIGGFDLGFERAGMRTTWFCENEEFCQQVLARRWPGVPIYPDIRWLRGMNAEPVDVLCGGFPCQDLSYAGTGAGLAGARSGLWSEYARLIGELRPRYVVVENVAALLARGFGTVLSDLATLGYDAEWDCIPASAVGAPHQRDRVWLVAYPNGEGLEGRGGEPWIPGTTDRQARGSASELADANGVRVVGAGLCAGEPEGFRWGRSGDGGRAFPDPSQLKQRLGGWFGEQEDAESGRDIHQWSVEPNVGRVADGVPARMDRLRALGNALVPQIAEWIGRRIIEYENSNERNVGNA